MKVFLLFLGTTCFGLLNLLSQDIAKKESNHVKKTASTNRQQNYIESEFPGGYDSISKFIQHHFLYPQKAIENNIQGSMIVEFVVGTDGKVQQVKMNKSIENCPECDEAAINVIRKLPSWTPAKFNGKAVESVFNLPITMELDADLAEEAKE